ncbi:carbohydrate ABC transporter permease [[Clostridium] polysaccharolyticum]|uniref:Raffinose/stachyose/melibiose transport system permease protein n=1 Tax=[Clostridium] polysaccharolyticum TaxID=29364 RepID=A0A1H9Y1H5_9FIRM|nr:sugar ABC transporter permease [[Clostridium] polysaccharolyticum]SES62547.1 raffinose/stachyose/melibiose transport system permease protein [[Clostridium] polysaccharolyticum]
MDKIFRDKKAIILFIAPGILLFTAILLVPICQAFFYSLCDWNALTKPEFVGFDNYIKLFADDEIMRIAIKNSVFFTLFSAVTQQILGLALAAVLTNVKKGRNIFKNIYYLPVVLSSAALGLLWSFLFNPKMGINQILKLMGIKGPLWLMDTKGFIVLPMWMIAVVALWQYAGSTMMLYMARISGISKSLYEAAYIDGATRFQAFKKLTLPLVKPMVATTLSLNCIGSLKFFDLVYNMTQGGPNHRTEVLATHLYDQGFKYFKYGYASAIGIVLLIMCLSVTLVISKCFKSEDYEM